MKRFLGFVKKEFFHIIRDPKTMLILFGLPVIQLLIFGYVIKNEVKDVTVAILDQSNDRVTRDISNKILSSGYFIFNETIASSDQIEEIFEKGDTKLVIVFEPGFSKNLQKNNTANIHLIADASDPNIASTVISYISGIVLDYMKDINQTEGLSYRIAIEPRMLYNQDLKSAFMFVPGTMALILMLVSAMMSSISIAREKEFGSMEVLLVSPLNPVQIILGKVTPYISLSVINAITIIALGNLVFQVPVRGSLIFLFLVTLLFILLALTLGILISTKSNNQQTAMFISMFSLLLPTMVLSGFIFPIENMPKILQWLTMILPPRWFITIVRGIMLKGIGITYLWKEVLILVGFIMLFTLLSIKNFKMRLE